MELANVTWHGEASDICVNMYLRKYLKIEIGRRFKLRPKSLIYLILGCLL
jgi:hypothetical protein